MLYNIKINGYERTYEGTPAEIISLLDYERCCDKMDDFQERQRFEKEKAKESPKSNFLKEVLSQVLCPLVTIIGIEVGKQLVDDEGFKWNIDDVVLEDEYPIKLTCSSLMADRMIKFEDLKNYKPNKDDENSDDKELNEKPEWWGDCCKCPYANECGEDNCKYSCEDFCYRYLTENSNKS